MTGNSALRDEEREGVQIFTNKQSSLCGVCLSCMQDAPKRVAASVPFQQLKQHNTSLLQAPHKFWGGGTQRVLPFLKRMSSFPSKLPDRWSGIRDTQELIDTRGRVECASNWSTLRCDCILCLGCAPRRTGRYTHPVAQDTAAQRQGAPQLLAQPSSSTTLTW